MPYGMLGMEPSAGGMKQKTRQEKKHMTTIGTTVEIVPGHEIKPCGDDFYGLKIGGYSPATVHRVRIDSMEAERILVDWNKMPGQRKIDERRVKEYSDRMERGLWHESEVSVAMLIDDNMNPVLDGDDQTRQTFWIINGQHTLRAIASRLCSAEVTFKFYKVTRRQLELLYSQFDDVKAKTGKVGLEPMAHLFGYRPATSARNPQKRLLVPSKIVEVVGRAIYWQVYGGMRARCERPHNHRLISLIDDTTEFVHWLIEIQPNPANPFAKDENGLSSSWLWRMGVIAPMYATWSAQRDLAMKFWINVVRPPSPDESTCAADKLRIILQENRKNGDWGTKPQSRIVKACEIAWNMFRVESGDFELPKGTPQLSINAIKTIDETKLEYFHFHDVSAPLDAVSTNVVIGDDTVVKKGRLAK
jgi:hypothetical protein